MVLTINIGNSTLELGVFSGEQLLFRTELGTEKNKRPDEYALQLLHILELYQIKAEDIKGVVISSVVPSLTQVLEKAAEKAFSLRPLMIGPGVKTGLNIRTESPSSLGSDIVADAVAAFALYSSPVIFFDLGTATVAALVEEGGILKGSIILPGVQVALDALSNAAAQLPEISLEPPKELIGTNSGDSMRAGSIYGMAAAIDGLAERLEERAEKKCTVVATGSFSELILPYCKREILHNGQLLLTGLYLIFKKNREIR